MGRLDKWAFRRLKGVVATQHYNYFSAFVAGIDRVRYLRSRNSGAMNFNPSHTESSIISSVRRQGFYVWNDFLSPEVCKTLRESIDSILLQQPNLIHPATPNDLRIHGIENICGDFKKIAADKTLSNIANIYFKEPARTAFALGARLESSKLKRGSGGGWHRDSNFPQLKAMVYLSDVEEKHGPFQLLSGSHRFMTSIGDNIIGRQLYGEVRWESENIERILRETNQERLKTFVGYAGTLIIFDSSAIHRGAPISEGSRYAVTNYFYPERLINLSLYEHFAPVAGHIG
jgi:hypothetical protein